MAEDFARQPNCAHSSLSYALKRLGITHKKSATNSRRRRKKNRILKAAGCFYRAEAKDCY
ncbi:IS630 transposase-related protein [Neisseria iguanae]|uniref:IS630 transposase-related protein n=1 Tax=Neisseria iguanae TaxID=90242 RepID=UPI000D10AF58